MAMTMHHQSTSRTAHKGQARSNDIGPHMLQASGGVAGDIAH